MNTTTFGIACVDCEPLEWNHPVYWFMTVMGLYVWNLILCCITSCRAHALDTFEAQCSSCCCLPTSSLDPPAYDALVLCPPPPSYKTAAVAQRNQV